MKLILSCKNIFLKVICGLLFGFELSLCLVFMASSTPINIIENKNITTTKEINEVALRGFDFQMKNTSYKGSPKAASRATAFDPLGIFNRPIEDKREHVERIFENHKGKPIYPITFGNKSRNDISITFDDGFQKSSVERVLKVLKKYEIKSTFFITGKALLSNSSLWKQAVEEGHEVCNHTYYHNSLNKLSNEAISNEIRLWEETVQKVLGKEYLETMKETFPYFRLPGGNGGKDKRVLKLVKDFGYIPIGWSDETYYGVLRHYDLKKASKEIVSEQVAKHVVSNLKSGSIILLHFNSFDTLKLEDMIGSILKKGYSIRSVTGILNTD